MQQVTKSHLYHLLVGSFYYVLCRKKTWSNLWNLCNGHQLCNFFYFFIFFYWVFPLRCFYGSLWNVCEKREWILMSSLQRNYIIFYRSSVRTYSSRCRWWWVLRSESVRRWPSWWASRCSPQRCWPTRSWVCPSVKGSYRWVTYFSSST